MKILIGIKHVPDTETKIKVASDGVSLDESGVEWIISPYDEFAIEEGLKIKEAAGDGEVVLVCAGPDGVSSFYNVALPSARLQCWYLFS